MHWRGCAILSLLTLVWTGCDDERDAIPCATCLAGPSGSGGAGLAPVVEREWVNVWGDEKLQRATSVAIDSNDNTYIAGYYSGRVDLGGGAELPETTSHDSFLLKLDADGTVQWAHHLGQTDDVPPSGLERVVVATSASGDVALGGNVIGTTTIGLSTPISFMQVDDNPEVFVAKLNSEGKALWARHEANNSGLGALRDIAFDPAGDVVVTGRFSAEGASVTFFGETITNEPMVLFAVKLAGETGELVWVKLYPAEIIDSTTSGLGVDARGHATICGDLMGDVFDVGGSPFLEGTATNVRDAFAFHLGEDGTRDWANIYGNLTDSQWAKDVAMDDTGAVYIAGSHLGVLDIDGNMYEADVHDAFVAKLDSNGNHLWSWASTDPDIQEAETIAWKDDHIAVAGRFNQRLSLAIPTLASLGNVDLWVASFDLVGNPEWSRSLGGFQTQQPEAVAIGPTGAVVVVGWADGDLEVDNEVIPIGGDKDILIARYQPVQPE